MKNSSRNQLKFVKAALISLIVSSLHIPVLKADAPDAAFFPSAKGDSWVYATVKKAKDKSDEDHFKMKVTMEGPWKEDDASGMIMTQKDHRGTMRQFVLMNAQGVFMQKLGLSKSYTPEAFSVFKPAVPYVIFPLTPGTKVHWEGRLKIAWVNQVIVFDGTVVGWEDIDVPAGHFHSIKLHFHETRDGKVTDEDAWYAAGVGQVKYDGGQFTKELESYTVSEASSTAK